MIPQELHAIYAPAWAACPECRPKKLRFIPDDGGGEDGAFYFGGTDYVSPDDQTDLAAALCFEAAWVWLKARNYENFGSEHYPTHHHAVVAAVVAVCKA